MPRQFDLAREAKLHQSRISMFETPGSNITLDTLSRVAAALRVGLVVKFVRFSEMLDWENEFRQDNFNVTKIQDDVEFLYPERTIIRRRTKRNRKHRRMHSVSNQSNQIHVGGNPYSAAAQMSLGFGQRRADVIPIPQSGIVSSPSLPKMSAVGAVRTYGL
jgi:transcriptional regulator with XRE-family HTH domain